MEMNSGKSRGDLTRRQVLGAALAAGAAALSLGADLRAEAQDQPHSQLEQAARTQAMQITSLSNLKQLALAVIVYCQNHNNCFPDADHWMDEISPYLGSPQALRLLMRDPAAPASQLYNYAFNRNLSGLDISKVENPSKTVMLFESTSGRANASDTGESVPHPGRHAGGTDYALVDGLALYIRDGNAVSFSLSDESDVGDTGIFTGRVIYEDGHPAANVRVGAQIQSGAMTKIAVAQAANSAVDASGAAQSVSYAIPKASWSEAVTGPDGVYRLTGLASEPYNVAVLPRDPSALDNSSPWVAAALEGVQGAAGKTVKLGDMVLTHGGFITGQVTDMAGKPLAGIGIGCYGPQRPATSAMVNGTRTDAAGRYSLRVAPGSNRVYIADDHWENKSATLTIALGETKTADFEIAPAPPSNATE